MTAYYIAIDWGSINPHVWLYQDDHCLDSRQSETGVTRLNGRSPAAVLAEMMTDWHEENTPVVMAGMVSSNVGWKVAPYLSVSARLSSIDKQLASIGDNIWIIPRLCVSHDDNHSVMCGEETQLIDMYASAPPSLYVMPGTHYKWVQAGSQQINDFRIVMTDKLHHLLLNHSLIGAGSPPQENATDAFTAGFKRGLNAPAILPRLFEVRTSHVPGALPREQVSEFLFGLLIGAEVASIHDYVAHQHVITLVARTSLAARYQQALQAMGCDMAAVTSDTAFQASARSIAHAVAN